LRTAAIRASGIKVRNQEWTECRPRHDVRSRSGTARVTDETKAEIADRVRRGATVDQLARDLGRTKSGIARIVKHLRLKHLQTQPIEFVYSAEFESPGAETTILRPAPELPSRKSSSTRRAPADLLPYLASLYETPLLAREQEAYCFRRMNYLKFRASQLRKEFDNKRPSAAQIKRVEALLKQAEEVKQLLVRSNLRLVVSVAKRYLNPEVDLFELVSDGNISLMRAVERFDYTKGFKLSTYATWAIENNLKRSVPARHASLERFRTGPDDRLNDSVIDTRTNPFESERANQAQRKALDVLLNRLNPRDREIIASRYGLTEAAEPQTLEALGRRFGVTKERVRQLESRALLRLRAFASKERLDIPGVC